MDADHPPRVEATAQSLDADNRFTKGAITYTLNHWMHAFTPEALDAWLPEETPDAPRPVAVVHGAAVPANGVDAAVAVLGSGRPYIGQIAAEAPALVPAFLEALRDVWPGAPVDLRDGEDDGLAEAGAVIAKREKDVCDALRDRCDAQNIPAHRRWIEPYRPSLAVLDGNESEDEREAWAEDVLLCEGNGHSVGVVFAPDGLSADRYFEALARFRGIVPAHDATPGALQMQQALLDARNVPHAYADDLSFLVSRGEPEAYSSTHLRWVPYATLEDAADWMAEHADGWHAVAARPGLHDRLPPAPPVVEPGTVHRPSLHDPAAQRLAAFVADV